MSSYSKHWAEDVIAELGHDCRDKNAVSWVLRWMARHDLDPRGESVTSSSDLMKADFEDYLSKRNTRTPSAP